MSKKSITFEGLKRKIISNLRPDVFRYDNDALILLNINLMKMGITPVRANYDNVTSEEFLRLVKSVVEKTDVRCARELYTQFKNIVPEWVATCDIECRDGKNGVFWVLVEH